MVRSRRRVSTDLHGSQVVVLDDESGGARKTREGGGDIEGIPDLSVAPYACGEGSFEGGVMMARPAAACSVAYKIDVKTRKERVTKKKKSKKVPVHKNIRN